MRPQDRPDEHRVVITGCGAVTPCGAGVGPLVDAVLAGRSALTMATLDDDRQVGGGTVDGQFLGGMDRTTALAVAAADEALTAAPAKIRPELAVIVGTGKPAMRLVERVHRDLLEHGPGSIPADFIQHALPNAPGDAIAQRFGCRGVRLAFVGACSTGWAIVSDAHDPITLAPDGAGIARAIRRALDAAGRAPDEIDHVNAHGTATRLNDLVETRGIRAAFGKHAHKLKVCSTKPVTGHLLSASGSVELIIALGALRAGVAPPTINLDEPDPALDLDTTPNTAVEHPIRHALVLNYGFGAHVGAVILSRWTGR